MGATRAGQRNEKVSPTEHSCPYIRENRLGRAGREINVLERADLLAIAIDDVLAPHCSISPGSTSFPIPQSRALTDSSCLPVSPQLDLRAILDLILVVELPGRGGGRALARERNAEVPPGLSRLYAPENGLA
jgi:hypothetical protein